MGIRKDLAELAEIHEEHDMGHTVAGWTGSIVCITGFAISGLAMVAASVPFFWAGVGVVVLGGALGWLLHQMGFGKEIGPRPVSERGMRRRPAPRTAGRHDRARNSQVTPVGEGRPAAHDKDRAPADPMPTSSHI
ncbi:HGxxPAAW family protein [Streptosporangium amethystogenes]|uniref:HGxxPAAW family protein n=1 Tax=Streptosporangium amethystogenes TaxID=2002 RepID=UPI00068F21E4|nr:HGxxPAAW family protein [Streptosporangium amethystogenes]